MSYLNELKETFMTKFGPSERESAIAYSFNSKLESHMKDRMVNWIEKREYLLGVYKE